MMVIQAGHLNKIFTFFVIIVTKDLTFTKSVVYL